MAGEMATRLCGSADLYEASRRSPMHSLNFVTCHDGFTLWDLVSYNRKHNEANGDDYRSGLDDNVSWNSGIEGPTSQPQVLELRRRRAKSFIATLLISQGVPMLLAGDEFLRSQQGNNNAWCQDNEISWLNWPLAGANGDFHRFVREMIALRKRHPGLRRRDFFDGKGPDDDAKPDIIWHGIKPGTPDFSSASRTLAFATDGTRTGREPDRDFYVACNAWDTEVAFRIPRAPSGKRWRRTVNTA